jgi:tetratricopeptide (TPR) repeat protein
VGADDSEGALQDLAGSRQIREHFGDRTGVAVTDKLVGNLYLRQRRYDVARQSLESASRSFRDLGDIKNLVEVEESLALCDLEEGDIRSAESRLNNAIARAEGVGYAAGVARGWLTLAMVREREGSVDAAVAAARSAYRVETNPDLRISLAARLIASRLGSDEKGSRP